ncbi:MAG: sugar ABC transporter ATP-binding protein [Hydrogenibacillus sp.]|nr:sugar ABC transporter ATP-binding protein [Hydrogenibacillus sp.]
MPLLEVKNLDKKFGPFYALKHVSLTIEPGEVHALVGENGAGKSTLIKIVTGVYKPDGGAIEWQGRPVIISSPKHARELGINVIHQERQLVPSLTGLENVYLGLPYLQFPFGLGVRWKAMRERAEKLKRELGMDVPLDRPAQDLSPPERTLLEILRAMMMDCRLLFLDEPTAALTDKETEMLFRLIGRLKSQGTSIIYVSHRLDEVLRLSDRITVLRNGTLAGTLPREQADRETLVRLMTNQEARAPERKGDRERHGAPVVLRARGVATADGKVKNAGLEVRKGEIVGLFGLAGAGRTELLEAIYGVRQKTAGDVWLEGQPATHLTPKQAIRRGMVLVPEDRRSHALVMGMTIRENMTLPVLSRFSNGVTIRGKRERAAVSDWMAAMKVKATGTEQTVGELSGGNQQKVVFAKALMSGPVVLLCDEPTQAVDVMTREDIHRLLRTQAEKGCGVVFVSSDLQEVLEIADRIVVMHEGETIAELPNEGLTTEKVLKICYDHRKGGKTGHAAGR